MINIYYSVSIDSLAVGTNVASSDAIEFGDFVSGMVHVPSGSNLTTLTWHSSTRANGVYLPANDASGAAVVQTVSAGNAYPIPADLVGARFLKITGNVAGVVGITVKE